MIVESTSKNASKRNQIGDIIIIIIKSTNFICILYSLRVKPTKNKATNKPKTNLAAVDDPLNWTRVYHSKWNGTLVHCEYNNVANNIEKCLWYA